jgi:GNAT superfamily N-acetyltransferase
VAPEGAMMQDVPGLRLRPMTEDEFAAYRARAVREYAEEKVGSGVWAAEDALERSDREFVGLLPDGIATAKMLLFTAEDGAGSPVGLAWLCLENEGDRGCAWVYDIEVVPERRGAGLGRVLLAAAEDEVRRHGAPALGLNVFGSNVRAQRLYASAGYRLVAQQMRKELA